MEQFEEIDLFKLSFPIFKLINNNWMLITAGDLENHNTMTASWGGFLILWHSPMAVIFIRPQRHTKKFIDKEKFFTLSFFEDKYKEALTFCGRHSGKDVNKDKETNLTPFSFLDSVAYKEASLIFLCEKAYQTTMQENNILNKDVIIKNFYPDKDYHEIYFAKIIKTKIKKSSNLL